MMLCDRKVYQNYHSKVVKIPLLSAFKNYKQMKLVLNKWIGITYIKKISINNRSNYKNLDFNKQFKLQKE